MLLSCIAEALEQTIAGVQHRNVWLGLILQENALFLLHHVTPPYNSLGHMLRCRTPAMVRSICAAMPENRM